MMTIDFRRETFPIALRGIFNSPKCPSLFDEIPETTLKKGAVIFNELNAHLFVYKVTKGMVRLYSIHDGKEMLEDYYQPGEMFNCEALLQNDQGEMVAKAMTQGTAVKKISVHSFRQAMTANASLYEKVLSSISASLSRTQERLRSITLLNSHQRVVQFLASHTMKSGRRVGYEWVIKPAMTHQEIGSIIGTGRQTVTTALNKLRKNGIIHFNRSYLIVRDMEALLKLLD